jgi:hypothetical protein
VEVKLPATGQAAAESHLAANRAEVERMVLADIEKYGVDVYRLYLEISQALPGAPGSDFAVDKAVKKLAVTYPESNARRIADAHVVYGAIRRRDLLQIERYLEEAEKSGAQRLLLPNGYEIVPQLVAAQYNYHFHIGHFAEAEKTLDYLKRHPEMDSRLSRGGKMSFLTSDTAEFFEKGAFLFGIDRISAESVAL